MTADEATLVKSHRGYRIRPSLPGCVRIQREDDPKGRDFDHMLDLGLTYMVACGEHPNDTIRRVIDRRIASGKWQDLSEPA